MYCSQKSCTTPSTITPRPPRRPPLGVPPQLFHHIGVGHLGDLPEGVEGNALQNLPGLPGQVGSDLLQPTEALPVFSRPNRGFEYVLHGRNEAGDGRVRALHPALRTPGALVRYEVRDLEADVGHVPHRGGGRRDRAARRAPRAGCA